MTETTNLIRNLLSANSRRPILFVALLALPLLLLVSQVDSAPTDQSIRSLVVRNYAEQNYRLYSRCVELGKQLELAVKAFVKEPSQNTLTRAREAWIEGRKTYGMTEALRFYNGPIDHPKGGVETFLNAWPLDEAYIDGTRDRPEAGLINNEERFPNLSQALLVHLNERGGEANVCLGWHAIEFMLWGQDHSVTGPGERSYRDFVDGAAEHADRRREFLMIVAETLVKHLKQVQAAWAPGQDNYRRKFEQESPEAGLRKILTGITVLSGFEMAGERLAVAYETRDQEEEHSCFSDTTHLDFEANQRGITLVYYGRGFGLAGPGLKELAMAAKPELARALEAQLEKSLAKIKAMSKPFDQAIRASDDSRERKSVLEALEALETQSDLLAGLGLTLGFEIALKPGG